MESRACGGRVPSLLALVSFATAVAVLMLMPGPAMVYVVTSARIKGAA